MRLWWVPSGRNFCLVHPACREESSDVEEDLCRSCLAGGGSGVVQSTSEQLAPAAHALGTVSTPTVVAIPLETAAGTLSPHIPVVNASPLVTTSSNTTALLSGCRKRLTDDRAARKKAKDRQSQQRRVGKMKALLTKNDTQAATIKRHEQTIRSLRASLQLKVGGRYNANVTSPNSLLTLDREKACPFYY